MKRFYDETGYPTDGADLKEAAQHIQTAFDLFTEAGYLHRDFFQFVDLEASLMMYDFELDKALGDS